MKKINPPVRPCMNITVVLVVSFHCFFLWDLLWMPFQEIAEFLQECTVRTFGGLCLSLWPSFPSPCPHSPTRSSEASEARCPRLEGSVFAQWVAAAPQLLTQTRLSQERLLACWPTLLRAASPLPCLPLVSVLVFLKELNLHEHLFLIHLLSVLIHASSSDQGTGLSSLPAFFHSQEEFLSDSWAAVSLLLLLLGN